MNRTITTARYTVYLTDAVGNKLLTIDDFVDDGSSALQYTRAVNTITDLTLTLPKKYAYLFVDQTRFKDYRIEVWRRIGTGNEYLDTDTAWFVRRVKKVVNESGVSSIQVTARSSNEILLRAIVASKGETAGASKTDKIDNIMYAVVNENLGASASAGRNRAPYFSVGSSTNAGITTTKKFPYDNVFNVLAELAQEAGKSAVPIFFDVIYDPNNSVFQFKLYANQRGDDRTVVVPFTLSLGNGLKSFEVEYDFTDEANYIYTGGSGQDSNQAIVEVYDSVRIGTSALNRRELFVSDTNTSDTNALTSIANTALQTARPKKIYTGQVESTDTAVYGRDWRFGDKLYADFGGDMTIARIDAVAISISKGEDKIAAQIRGIS